MNTKILKLTTLCVTFVLATLLQVGVYAQSVSVNSAGINAIAADASAKLMLKVAGPNDFFEEVKGEGGSLNWSSNSAVDGSYRYDFYISPAIEGEAEVERVYGSFEISNGVLSQSSDADVGMQPQSNEGVNSLALLASKALDFLVPVSHAQDLEASGITPLITFDDTSVTNPGRAAQIETNLVNSVTGRISFEIEGASNATEILDFDVDANADQSMTIDLEGDIGFAEGSVFIDKSVNSIGVGTTTPLNDIDVVSSDPTIRLEDTNGVAWEINSNPNSTNFDIRDTTNDISPLLMTSGSFGGQVSVGGGSLTGASSVGTIGATLLVSAPDDVATTQLRVLEENATTAVRTLFNLLCETCTPAFRFNRGTDNQTWFFRMLQSGNFSIDDPSTAGTEAEFRSGGNLVIGGALTQSSSRTIKKNIEYVNDEQVLDTLLDLKVAKWTYNHESDDVRHMGPIAEDFYAAFSLGDTDKGIATVDTAGVAFAAIRGLNERLQAKDAELNELRQSVSAKDQEMDELRNSVVLLEERLNGVIYGMAQQENAEVANVGKLVR